VEEAYALAKLVRNGTGSHEAVLPEEISDALDAYRLPLSAIANAQVVVVLGDVPVTERAPIVELWIKQARRNGAKVVASADDPAVRDAERIVLVWSGPGGRGGARIAELAERLGLAGKDGCGAFYLPQTPNGRGVADAWAACSDEEAPEPDSIGLLIVSGDEAAGNANVRALAERAESVIVVSMFHGLAAGWADLVLPGTSYLERDGTYVNLEGRLQRLRQAASPPGPGELEWISQLGARFGVEIAPHAPALFAELSARCYGGLSFGEVGEQAPLRGYVDAPEHVEAPPVPEPEEPAAVGTGLRLVVYKPLFSGPAVERVAELQFQRPPAEVELAPADAKTRGLSTGDVVTVSAKGASVTLRVRVSRSLRAGVARVPAEHAGGLLGTVEIAAAGAGVSA
jgi:predicted molibdopterin-dependent oxidoreductase YjgC